MASEGSLSQVRPKDAGPSLSRWAKGHSALDLLVMAAAVALVAVVVLVPIVFVLYGSLRSDSPTAAQSTFTLDQWRLVYTTRDYLVPLSNTLQTAAAVTLLSVVFGTFMAWITARTDTPLRSLLDLLIVAPLLLSPFVGAMAWVALAAPRTGFLNGLLALLTGGQPVFNIFSQLGIVWCMFLYYAPYAYMFTAAAMGSMDPSLEDASSILGSGVWSTLRRITLPLMMPAIMAAALLIFVFTAEMFSIPGLLGGPVGYVNIPYGIYRAINSSPPQWPVAATLGTMLLWLTVIGMYLYRKQTAASRRFVTVTPRGYRPRLVKLGRWKHVTFLLCAAYIIVALILPYGALVLGSLLKFPSQYITPGLLTLRNYDVLFATRTADALKNTLVLSVISATVIVILAVVLNYMILRTRLPGRGIIDTLGTIPVAVPGIVLAIGLVWFYVKVPLPIYGALGILALAYVARHLPDGLRITSSTLIQIDRELEESSRTCGATALQTIVKVTMPLLRPAMLYAWLLTFIVVSREISASIVLWSPGSMVLSVLLWDLMDVGAYGRAYAVAIILTLIILAVVIIAKRLFGVELIRRRSTSAE